jgi:hypothetical protein
MISDDLGQRCAGMSYQRQLQGNSHSIPALPARTDDLHVRRLEGVEPGQLVTVSRDRED